MRYQTTVAGQTFTVEVEDRGGQVTVTLGDRSYTADLRWIAGQECYSLLLDGISYEIFAEEHDEGFRVYVQGHPFEVVAQDARLAALRSIAHRATREVGEAVIRAPMPGKVIVLEVEPGQVVAEGQALLVIEAMKMHNEVRAPRAGTIDQVRVSLGQRVDRDQVLVTIK